MVVLQGDLGTALVLFAIVLGMLWVIGAPARLFLGSFLVGDRARLRARGLAARARRPAHRLPEPDRELRLAGLAGQPRLLRPRHRRAVGLRHRRQQPEVGQPAGRAHRLHLRDHRRGVRAVRNARRARPLRHAGLRRASASPRGPPTGSSSTPRPGIVVWLLVAGAHQHRDGARPAPRDRHPVAVDLVRRVGAAADAGLARPAAVVRSHRARRTGRPACPAPRPRRRWSRRSDQET